MPCLLILLAERIVSYVVSSCRGEAAGRASSGGARGGGKRACLSFFCLCVCVCLPLQLPRSFVRVARQREKKERENKARLSDFLERIKY